MHMVDVLILTWVDLVMISQSQSPEKQKILECSI